MDMSQPTDQEMDTYPHVFFTSDMTWDPSILDDEETSDPSIFPEDFPIDLLVNQFGEVLQREVYGQERYDSSNRKLENYNLLKTLYNNSQLPFS